METSVLGDANGRHSPTTGNNSVCGKGAGRYKPGAQITHLGIRQTLDPVYPAGGYLIVTGYRGDFKKLLK